MRAEFGMEYDGKSRENKGGTSGKSGIGEQGNGEREAL
jgi:hypothetical protein